MGYHTFVLRYSAYSDGAPFVLPLKRDTHNLLVNPKSVYPAPMRDIARTFLIIREYGDEWLVETEKIAICDFYAGAHDCAMYSVYWQDPIIWEFFGKEPGGFKPAAAILAYGVYDYHLMFGEIMDPVAQSMSEAASVAFSGIR